MAVGRCVLHLVAVPQLITSQLAFQSSRRCPQSADPPATHHENCFASWKWVNNSIIKNENSSSVASWLHKSLECWNRSESARLQGISEGKSTINRRLDGNEMIMMPSAFGKECTNILFALKGCCILERCVCRLKMWLRYLPQDKLVPVPSTLLFGNFASLCGIYVWPCAMRAPSVFDAEWISFCFKKRQTQIT